MKHLLQVILYKMIYGITYAVSLMPMAFLYTMASFASFLAYHVIGYRKTIVVQNIARSFPDMNYGEIHRIVKKFYACFTAYFAEIIKSISIPAEKLDKKITIENQELIDQHINAGRNVIVSLGHCGNWEILHFMPYRLRYAVYAVYKPLRSEIMNRLMIKLRSRFGMLLLPNKSAIRHLLTKNTPPAVYLFLADQCPRIQKNNYKVKLLNQETYVFSGMEKVAHASKAAVIYLHIKELSKGHYKITCMPICSEASSMPEETITRHYIDLLTKNIREAPSGWLWTHKRWKR